MPNINEANKVATLQDNIRRPIKDDNLTHYAYWISGANSKHAALEQYDLLRTGYVRIFVLQPPAFVDKLLPKETAKFVHLLEFGNVGIDGIQGYSVETTQATGGYAGTSIELPTGTKDDTSSITIKLYETQGSLVRTYIDFWITGTFDPITGLNHYHGARMPSIYGIDGQQDANSMYFSQANHTMEVLAVATDPTGDLPEYSCLLTNMFPKGSDHSHFNYDPGSHELVQLSLEFTANKYLGTQINYLGKIALEQFRILKNFMLTYSGYDEKKIRQLNSGMDITEWGGPFDRSTSDTERGFIPQTGPNNSGEYYHYNTSDKDRRVDGIKAGSEYINKYN